MNKAKRKRSTKNLQRPRKSRKAQPNRHSSHPASSSSENLDEIPHQGEIAAADSTQNTRPRLPVEIVVQILSEFITEDALNNRQSYGKGSRLRKWRRTDICSILLTSREFYKEASKLIQERSQLEIGICGDVKRPLYKPGDRRIGVPGAWNQFRKISISLHPTVTYVGFLACSTAMIDEIGDAWQLLQKYVNTQDAMPLQQVEISCFGYTGQPASISNATWWPGRPVWSLKDQTRLRNLLRVTGKWGPVLTFDRHLRYIPQTSS